MNKLTIEQLEPIKLPLIQKLYKTHYPSGKAKRDELIFVAYQDRQIVGVVRFRTIDKWRLLTGMLVIPEYRNQGIANQLMSFCKDEVLADNDYCFAYSHLGDFYGKYNFAKPDSNHVPQQIRSLFERYVNSGKDLLLMKFEKSAKN